MSATLFVTFFTDAAYRAQAERLGRCCEVFGLRFRALEGRDYGNWRRNCNQKPQLLESLRASVTGPIAWLDADCVIHHLPELLNKPPDGDATLWRAGEGGDKWYVNSAVMLWNDTPTANEMISDWAQLSRESPDSLADPLLKQVCDRWADRSRIARLPDEYGVAYFRPPEGLHPEEIVISRNERASEAPDADSGPRRRRFELVLPY
jgi:hypothetical protein